MQGSARQRKASFSAAESLQHGRQRGGRLAAIMDLHQRRDPLDAVMRRDASLSRNVGLVDHAAHKRHTSQAPLFGGLFPLRRVSPWRDLGDALFPDCVPGLILVKAVHLHRRRRRQHGPKSSSRGLYQRGRCLSTANGRHHPCCTRAGPSHNRSCRRGIGHAARGGRRGADPFSTPPIPPQIDVALGYLDVFPSPVTLRGGEGGGGEMPRPTETPIAVLQASLARAGTSPHTRVPVRSGRGAPGCSRRVLRLEVPGAAVGV